MFASEVLSDDHLAQKQLNLFNLIGWADEQGRRNSNHLMGFPKFRKMFMFSYRIP